MQQVFLLYITDVVKVKSKEQYNLTMPLEFLERG